MKQAIKILKESGEFDDYEDYLIYGNPANPVSIILFEKRLPFEKAVDAFKDPTRLFICSLGVPSIKCLNYVRTLRNKKILYFGDLDPISFFTFLTFSYAKRKPAPKDKQKFNIKYAGVSLIDYKKYLSNKNVLINISNSEKIVLSFIEKFKIPQLKHEIKFLKKTGKKIEIEALNLLNFEMYLKDKIE